MGAPTPPPIIGGHQPKAGDMARLSASITHIFVSQDGVHVFFNGEPVPMTSLESLSVEIVAPGADEGAIAAILSTYPAAGGTPTGQQLFPGVVELIASHRRLSITCTDLNSFDGLFLRLGIEDDGIGAEASGVQGLRIVITQDIKDAKVTWEDGREDSIIAE